MFSLLPCPYVTNCSAKQRKTQEKPCCKQRSKAHKSAYMEQRKSRKRLFTKCNDDRQTDRHFTKLLETSSTQCNPLSPYYAATPLRCYAAITLAASAPAQSTAPGELEPNPRLTFITVMQLLVLRFSLRSLPQLLLLTSAYRTTLPPLFTSTL